MAPAECDAAHDGRLRVNGQVATATPNEAKATSTRLSGTRTMTFGKMSGPDARQVPRRPSRHSGSETGVRKPTLGSAGLCAVRRQNRSSCDATRNDAWKASSSRASVLIALTLTARNVLVYGQLEGGIKDRAASVTTRPKSCDMTVGDINPELLNGNQNEIDRFRAWSI